jgi:hypothetical protein
MSDVKRVLWITDSEEVADALTAVGESATVWEGKLTNLKLAPREDLQYRVLVPPAMIGIALSFLRENPFVEIATVGPKRPKLPWWATAIELALPYFTEKVWIIRYNPDADIRKYLRSPK